MPGPLVLLHHFIRSTFLRVYDHLAGILGFKTPDIRGTSNHSPNLPDLRLRRFRRFRRFRRHRQSPALPKGRRPKMGTKKQITKKKPLRLARCRRRGSCDGSDRSHLPALVGVTQIEFAWIHSPMFARIDPQVAKIERKQKDFPTPLPSGHVEGLISGPNECCSEMARDSQTASTHSLVIF